MANPATMTLDNWLSAATRGLAPESAAQVRTEIAEHYESALASGIPPADAVAALGDPKPANQAYRRCLLTGREGRYLGYLRKQEEAWQFPNRSHIGFGWMVAMNLFMAVTAWTANPWAPGPRINPFASVACAFLWGFISYRVWLLFKMPDRAPRLRRELVIAFIAHIALLPVVGLPWLFVGAIALVTFVNLRLHVIIRRKLPVAQWPKGLYL